MKWIRFILVTVFIVLVSNLYGMDIKFLDNETVLKVVNIINDFRINPFGYTYIHNNEFPELTEQKRKEIFDRWRNIQPQYIIGLPELKFDEYLTNIAYEELTNFLNNPFEYNNEEADIVIVGFFNYNDFYSLLNNMLYKSFTMEDDKYRKIFEPYEKIGLAIAFVKMKYQEINYNFVVFSFMFR